MLKDSTENVITIDSTVQNSNMHYFHLNILHLTHRHLMLFTIFPSGVFFSPTLTISEYVFVLQREQNIFVMLGRVYVLMRTLKGCICNNILRNSVNI